MSQSVPCGTRPASFEALAASVLPDADLFWFYLVDHRRVQHHEYWTHIPFWWATITTTWYLGALVMRRGMPGVRSAVFFGNVFLHLGLDTVAGGVPWLAPLSRHVFAVVEVPAVHRWWVWNFLLHWTFAVEGLLVACALVELARRPGCRRCEAHK